MSMVPKFKTLGVDRHMAEMAKEFAFIRDGLRAAKRESMAEDGDEDVVNEDLLDAMVGVENALDEIASMRKKLLKYRKKVRKNVPH